MTNFLPKLHIVCINKTNKNYSEEIFLREFALKDGRKIPFPERDLHPHQQRKKAIEFVKNLNSVKENITILTNSNFIINELNSLMMLHNRYHESEQGTLKENQKFCKDVIKKHQEFYKTQDILSIILNPKQVIAEIKMPDKTMPIVVNKYGMQDTGFYDDINEINTVQSRLIQGF